MAKFLWKQNIKACFDEPMKSDLVYRSQQVNDDSFSSSVDKVNEVSIGLFDENTWFYKLNDMPADNTELKTDLESQPSVTLVSKNQCKKKKKWIAIKQKDIDTACFTNISKQGDKVKQKQQLTSSSNYSDKNCFTKKIIIDQIKNNVLINKSTDKLSRRSCQFSDVLCPSVNSTFRVPVKSMKTNIGNQLEQERVDLMQHQTNLSTELHNSQNSNLLQTYAKTSSLPTVCSSMALISHCHSNCRTAEKSGNSEDMLDKIGLVVKEFDDNQTTTAQTELQIREIVKPTMLSVPNAKNSVSSIAMAASHSLMTTAVVKQNNCSLIVSSNKVPEKMLSHNYPIASLVSEKSTILTSRVGKREGVNINLITRRQQLVKIPRPCNAFFIFANECRSKYLQAQPFLSNSDISRRSVYLFSTHQL